MRNLCSGCRDSRIAEQGLRIAHNEDARPQAAVLPAKDRRKTEKGARRSALDLLAPRSSGRFPLAFERLQVLDGLFCRHAHPSIVEVDQHIAHVSDSKLLHI